MRGATGGRIPLARAAQLVAPGPRARPPYGVRLGQSLRSILNRLPIQPRRKAQKLSCFCLARRGPPATNRACFSLVTVMRLGNSPPRCYGYRQVRRDNWRVGPHTGNTEGARKTSGGRRRGCRACAPTLSVRGGRPELRELPADRELEASACELKPRRDVAAVGNHVEDESERS